MIMRTVFLENLAPYSAGIPTAEVITAAGIFCPAMIYVRVYYKDHTRLLGSSVFMATLRKFTHIYPIFLSSP